MYEGDQGGGRRSRLHVATTPLGFKFGNRAPM
jgi:hypothetical protein